MKVKISTKDGPGRVIELETGANLIGRWDQESGSFPEIDLEAEDSDAKVSRKHAAIFVGDGEVMLEDLGSLNGTFINSMSNQVQPGVRVPVRQGDQIIVGSVRLIIEE